MKRWIILASAALAAVTAGAVPWVAANASASSCQTAWGSLAKTHSTTAVAPLTGVRAGRHACFDRLVLDVGGKADGHRVEYVPEVTEDGSGNVVPLRGGAKLQVIASAPAYDDQGRPTYTPANRRELADVTGWQTFRQVAWAGSFEGQSTFGLGVRARLPFRVSVLDGPGSGSRMVVDVAHSW